MTTVAQIIIDSYRQSNLVGINTAVTTAQQVEALRYLNRIVKSVYGYEAGEQLRPIQIGRDNIYRPAGYPGYTTVPSNNWVVPKNSQLMVSLPNDYLYDSDGEILTDILGDPLWAASDLAVYLDPNPDDGARFGVSDIAGNFSSFNLVVFGNGRTIEDAAYITVDTDNLNRTWFFRQDTANWYKVTDLVAADTFPFPEEFDDLFIGMLSLRLNPAYAADMDPQSQVVMTRSRSQFQARYRQHHQVPSELGLLYMPNMTADRYYWRGVYSDPTSVFDSGMLYPWYP